MNESPLLLTLDTDRQASMLSLVEGEKVTEPDTAAMDMASAFMVRLIELSATEAAAEAGFNPASEAFFRHLKWWTILRCGWRGSTA